MAPNSSRKILAVIITAAVIVLAAVALYFGFGARRTIPAPDETSTRLTVYVTNELMSYREPCG